MIRILLFIILFFLTSLIAKNEIFILPNDSKQAYDKIITSIHKAESKIDIYMYNFSYKILAKSLKDAKKRGVVINLYLDLRKVEKNDKIYKYLKKNSIKSILLKNKNHLKVAIFDEKEAIFGSLNWTKDSFAGNYELLYFSDEKALIKKLLSKLKKVK